MNDVNAIPPEQIGMVCGNCVHCLPGPQTKGDVLARNCYRYPPTAFGVLTQQGVAVMAVRPEIRVDTPACGEFETEDDDVDVPPASGGLTS